MLRFPGLLLNLLLIACVLSERTVAQDLQGKLVITGSSTVAPLALELAKRFEKFHPGTRVDVQSGGSSRGVADTRQGLADIGMISRTLYAHEKDLRGTALALDGIAVILHKNNPVPLISKAQLLQIYTGKISNWQELGGRNGKIVVVSKAAGRSTLDLFVSYLQIKDSEIKADIIIGENEQGIKTVLGNPLAIGYVSIGAAAYHAQAGAALKLLPLEGVKATVDNVKQGTYPLSRSLSFIFKPDLSPLAKKFMAFSLAPDQIDLVKEQNFVPVTEPK